MKPPLIPNEDYYLDKDGRFVLTANYLRKRGDCCGNRCRHCPYAHRNVRQPNRGTEPSP